MTREEKSAMISDLTAQIKKYGHFYLTDISSLNSADTSNLRRLCFSKDVKLVVVKNTMFERAMVEVNPSLEALSSALKGSTAVMFCQEASTPAKVIKEFRQKKDKPILKAAYVSESIFVGDNQVEALATLKSKEELIGEVIGLLQSPIKTVLSQLQSGGHKLSGILTTLADKK